MVYKSKMSGDPKDLGDRLHAWLTKEMHFQPQGKYCNMKIPSPDILRKICRGKAGDIWEHVITAVHSAETVKRVKGNLSLQSRSLSHRGSLSDATDEVAVERDALLQRRKTLGDQLSSSQMATHQVELENERLVKEIGKTETGLRSSWQKSQDLRRKTMLLKASAWQLDLEIKKLTEYENSLRHKAEVLINRARNSQTDDVLSQSKSSQDGVMETPSTKQTRDSCSDITTFLLELFRGEFNHDRSAMQKRRDGLWRNVENVVMENSPTQVVLSLANIAQENAFQLRNITNKIDVNEDIKKLKFKFENGQLQDESTEPSTLQSVHQLLMESQRSHFMSFIEQEGSRNIAFRYGERLQKAKMAVFEILDRDMKDNPGARDLAKHIVALELKTIADRAAVHVLQECLAELQEKVSKAAHDKEVLYTKYQKIQHFRELTNQKQDVVRVLSKQNIMAQHKLDEQRKQIVKYAEKSLLHHKSEIHSTSDQLHNCVSKEVESFAKIALPYLHFTKTHDSYKSYVMDLSIHQLNPRPDSQSQTILRTLQHLNFMPYKAPECLLPHVMDIHQKIYDLEVTLKNHHDLANTLEGRTKHDLSIADHILGLCEQIKSSDKQQEKEVLPKLQTNIQRSTEALSLCLQLKDIIQDWWEQPGQNVVTWTRLDDLTFKQWKDRWTVAVTRLRQFSDT